MNFFKQNEIAILNIGAGKIEPFNLPESYFLINLDKSYFSKTTPHDAELTYDAWLHNKFLKETMCLSWDVYELLERTYMKFDRICLYRFLEHVPFTKVPYFIYLVANCTLRGGFVDVIVPNYRRLAKMILKDSTNDPEFEAKNILLTTELLNEPPDPHASIWTLERAKYFWELENRFELHSESFTDPFLFDGRDTYFRFIAERV